MSGWLYRNFRKEMQVITGKRKGVMTNAGGEFVNAAATDISILGTIPQPLSSKDLRQMREGVDLTDYLKTYTEDSVEVLSDYFYVDSELYRTMSITVRREEKFNVVFMRKVTEEVSF